VRFDSVFEGYVPVRKLAGDYFELNPLATALVGRRSGFAYRLGDGVRVRVDRIEKPSGRVSLELAP
jgi:ribonuclease R